MNAHTKLQLHLSRHMYKTGRNKGDAPADSSRRGKTHFRVVKGNGGQMIVRMHNADLITAYEDGHIVLNTNRWHTSPTTRKCMNHALSQFFGSGGLCSVRLSGHAQTGIRMGGNTYRYYDGMAFGDDRTMWGDPITFEAKRTDREQTAAFRKAINDSGFVGTFPVLYETAGVPTNGWVPRTQESMCSADLSGEWPNIVALVKYPTYYARMNNKPQHSDHKAALKSLIASHTRTMTKLVSTGKTVL
jgi:hypothetical protein